MRSYCILKPFLKCDDISSISLRSVGFCKKISSSGGSEKIRKQLDEI